MKGITKTLFLLILLSVQDFIKAQTNNAVYSNITSILAELNKPSKAFTAVLMVYMCLIIIGAVLVLILVKPKIDK